MYTLTTVQRSAEPTKAGTALVWFQRIVGSVKANPRAFPAGLANLTPHMCRDIGLENRAAMHWLEATPHIVRDSRWP